ncbi:hypothetical protein FS834_10530 [Agrobacterium vitis]|nr:hypothetical protein [Allorhizobium ampelinum]MCF1492959.1 hypothetical protein [Allorhizobium ampelinum]
MFVVLLVIDPTSHELGSPANPVRFNIPIVPHKYGSNGKRSRRAIASNKNLRGSEGLEFIVAELRRVLAIAEAEGKVMLAYLLSRAIEEADSELRDRAVPRSET